MHKILTAALFLLGLPPLAAQFTFAPAYPPVTAADGSDLSLAWLGGLNAPQTQSTDLDGDGLQDLLLFDRAGDVALALRGDGLGNYAEAPELAAGLPRDLLEWVILRDYDGDGNDDLFTYAPLAGGFRVFRGGRDATGLLTFSPTYGQLTYPLDNGTTTPIFVSNIDYPSVDDIDFDGDLDILTFSVGGGYVEYYRNQSVERGFGTDTLLFTLETDCWGGFFESGLTTELDLADGPGDCFRASLTGEEAVTPRHAGSTLLAVDVTGNGLKDIMLGDVSFEFLALGLNTGTRDRAYISAQDPTWPSDGTPVNIPFFPAAFYVDVDRDGVRDLVASPTQTLNVEDVDVAWYYRNAGTEDAPDFVFRDSQLFVRQSVDYGTGARPAVFDYDADGRPDLVIGNNDEYTGDIFVSSQLRLFRNVTPPGGPVAFEFADDDFLDLVQFQRTTWAFAPTFGDLDGDGDEDALLGERAGKLIFIENLAGKDRPARFAAPVFDWMDIDAGQFSKPFIGDLDRDGLPDLVIGGFDGRIRLYRNVGTATAPAFDPDPLAAGNVLQLGGINTNVAGSSTGHPTPVVFDYDDRFLLVTGNRAGTLEAYGFTDPTQSFTPLGDTLQGFDAGGFSDPAFGDFDGDGLLEMVVGTERGGVTYFTTDLENDRPTALLSPSRAAFDFAVSPNPVTDALRVSGLAGTQVRWLELVSATGRVLRSVMVFGDADVRLSLVDLPAGLYSVVARGGRGTAVRRVVRR